jgi:Rod binding domain-containing protein
MGASTFLSLASAQTNALQSREDNMIQQLKSPSTPTDDAKIDKGAREFESILVGSWLQQAEQSFATLPGAEDDQDPGRDQMMSLGVETLSKSLAAAGGIGIGKMIARAMHANADKAKTHQTGSAVSTGQTPTPEKIRGLD